MCVCSRYDLLCPPAVVSCYTFISHFLCNCLSFSFPMANFRLFKMSYSSCITTDSSCTVFNYYIILKSMKYFNKNLDFPV